MNIKINKPLVFHYFLNFSAFITLVYYIWFRFFRERLPRDIPFSLSVFGFFILVELCCIYGYIVWTYMMPTKKPNEISELIMKEIFKPLDDFDDFIKNLPIIKTYYPKFFILFAHKCEYIFKTPIFEAIFFFFPRITLITTFMIDIFYFHQLFYIYKVLFIGILLFLRRYIIYSIKKFKITFLAELQLYIENIFTKYEYGIHPSEWPENIDPDDEDDDDIPPTMSLPLDIYVKYYSESKVYKNFEPDKHMLSMTSTFHQIYPNIITKNGQRFFKQKTPEETLKEDLYFKQLKQNLNDLLQIYVFLEYYNKIINEYIYIKKMKIVIYTLYLICWLYILIVSIHTLDIDEVIKVLNATWLTKEEPFSELSIHEIF